MEEKSGGGVYTATGTVEAYRGLLKRTGDVKVCRDRIGVGGYIRGVHLCSFQVNTSGCCMCMCKIHSACTLNILHKKKS